MPATQPALHLQPQFSYQLAGWVFAIHLLAAGVTLSLPGLADWSKAVLLGLTGFSVWHTWRLHLVRSHPYAVQEATFYTPDNWRIHTPQGSRFAALDDSSFLHPWLCVLNLRSQSGRMHTLLLMPDSVPPDTLRRLRVRLRFD